MQMHEKLFSVCFCNWESKMDIPASDSFVSPLRRGFLLKLCGRGWLYSGTWKKRYCVLDGSKFYFYEKEVSKGNEKSCGVLNLEYFDACEEGISKDKKNSHIFVVGTSGKGFFDNRHQFSAETGEELQSWIRAIQTAITDARENRRKNAGKKQQRHLEGTTPPSQGSDEVQPACLVAATKDRVRGPQGRRLPQRKSMMPTSRSKDDEEDTRQRSISLSSPKRLEEEEDEATTPISPSEGVGKWLSLSMEDVERDNINKTLDDDHRSSSVFELQKRGGGKVGLLGGTQHAALTRELEMRLKAGRMPAHVVRPTSEAEEDKEGEEECKKENKRLEELSSRVDEARRTLSLLEDKMDILTKKVDSGAGDVMLQLTVTLKEAERINEECRRALSDANLARKEYQLLAKECRETLDRLNSPEDPEAQQHGA